MRLFAAIAVAFLATATVHVAPALAEPPAKLSPKLQDIHKLMEITGAAALGAQVMQQLIPTFRQSMPNVPQKFWDDFSKEANPNELVDRVAVIYDKYLTHEEVRQIIKFYETPVGKKLVSVLPQVTQESMVVGQNWGRELGERVVKRLQAEQNKEK